MSMYISGSKFDEIYNEVKPNHGEFHRDCAYDAATVYFARHLPLWEPPTAEELEQISQATGTWQGAVLEFVRRRNAALLPKPVDPRRKKLVAAFSRGRQSEAEQLADIALEALGVE